MHQPRSGSPARRDHHVEGNKRQYLSLRDDPTISRSRPSRSSSPIGRLSRSPTRRQRDGSRSRRSSSRTRENKRKRDVRSRSRSLEKVVDPKKHKRRSRSISSSSDLGEGSSHRKKRKRKRSRSNERRKDKKRERKERKEKVCSELYSCRYSISIDILPLEKERKDIYTPLGQIWYYFGHRASIFSYRRQESRLIFSQYFQERPRVQDMACGGTQDKS